VLGIAENFKQRILNQTIGPVQQHFKTCNTDEGERNPEGLGVKNVETVASGCQA